MSIDDVRTLYAYNEWANARLLDIIRSLTDEQRVARIESSFPSILFTFGHIVSSEWIWLRRFLGDNPTEVPAWADYPEFSHLTSTLADVEAQRRALLQSLTDSDLQAPLNYLTIKGEPYTNRMLDLLLHLVNHSSYHRGQLTTMLRHVGATPVATDFVVYLRES